jgi:hypothetical protein
VLRNKAFVLRRLARTDEGALLGAIVALLVAGIVAAIVVPTDGTHRSFRQQRGSLVAPPPDGAFTDLQAAPDAPSSAIGATEPTGTTPQPGPPQPSPTAPAPGVPAPPEAPDDDGLLPDLPILPPPFVPAHPPREHP